MPATQRSCFLRRVLDNLLLILTILTLIPVNSPVHIYGLSSDCDKFESFSAPGLFVATQMLMQPSLLNLQEQITKLHLRKILALGSVMLSCGIILAGSFQVIFHERTITFVLFYGALSGIGSFLINGLLKKILEDIFDRKDNPLIDVIMSVTEGLGQLIFPIIFLQIIKNFGQEMSLLLLGSILLHILPLILLISHFNLPSSTKNLVRYQSVMLNDLKTTPGIMKRWDKLIGINNNFENYDDENDVPMKNLTSQGVEILDTIPEEDETGSSEKFHVPRERESAFRRKFRIFSGFCGEFWRIFMEMCVNPFRTLYEWQVLLSGIILKATDVFIYVLMISGLPCFASGKDFHLDQLNCAILISLMGVPVIVVTLASVWMEDVLSVKAKHWHTAGEICKFTGCLVLTSSRTVFFLRVGVLLLGSGHGVSGILQDRVLKEQVPEDDWRSIKSHIYSISGFLVFIFTIFVNHLLQYFTLASIFLIVGLFYSAAIFIFTLTNYF
ncbi:MFS transporter superfamily [Sergentomyia squamirostris]